MRDPALESMDFFETFVNVPFGDVARVFGGHIEKKMVQAGFVDNVNINELYSFCPEIFNRS